MWILYIYHAWNIFKWNNEQGQQGQVKVDAWHHSRAEMNRSIHQDSFWLKVSQWGSVMNGKTLLTTYESK